MEKELCIRGLVLDTYYLLITRKKWTGNCLLCWVWRHVFRWSLGHHSVSAQNQ